MKIGILLSLQGGCMLEGYVTQGGAEYRLPWAMVLRPCRAKCNLKIAALTLPSFENRVGYGINADRQYPLRWDFAHFSSHRGSKVYQNDTRPPGKCIILQYNHVAYFGYSSNYS